MLYCYGPPPAFLTFTHIGLTNQDVFVRPCRVCRTAPPQAASDIAFYTQSRENIHNFPRKYTQRANCSGLAVRTRRTSERDELGKVRLLFVLIIYCYLFFFLLLLFYLILSYLILSYLVLSCLVLSCLVLSCLVLSYFILLPA